MDAANRALHSNFSKASTSVGCESGFLMGRQVWEAIRVYFAAEIAACSWNANMWVNDHYQWPFLFPISLSHSFSPLFPHDPTLQPLMTDVLYPRNVHGLQPLMGSQRLGSVHLVGASSYSARKASPLWIQCPSGDTPFPQSHPQCSLHILSSHCAFWTRVSPSTQDACFGTHVKAQEAEWNKT